MATVWMRAFRPQAGWHTHAPPSLSAQWAAIGDNAGAGQWSAAQWAAWHFTCEVNPPSKDWPNMKATNANCSSPTSAWKEPLKCLASSARSRPLLSMLSAVSSAGLMPAGHSTHRNQRAAVHVMPRHVMPFWGQGQGQYVCVWGGGAGRASFRASFAARGAVRCACPACVRQDGCRGQRQCTACLPATVNVQSCPAAGLKGIGLQRMQAASAAAARPAR